MLSFMQRHKPKVLTGVFTFGATLFVEGVVGLGMFLKSNSEATGAFSTAFLLAGVVSGFVGGAITSFVENKSGSNSTASETRDLIP